MERSEIAGHAAARADFHHGAVSVAYYRVARLDDLVDRHALLREDAVPEPPYWAHLWTGAVALARFIADRADPGRRVLDLGCGLGLPGLVAAAKGAEVWFADREAAALEFVRASARLNGLERIHTIRFDFTRERLGVRFDAILGAEIVYEPRAYAALADLVADELAPGGSLYVTDAFRADAETFFTELRGRGFAGERHALREWEDGRPHPVCVWRLRRDSRPALPAPHPSD